MREKIIDILEKHFDEPEKIDDWTTIYMQEKFIEIAIEIEALIEEYNKNRLNEIIDKTVHKGTIPQSDEWYKEVIDNFLKQRNND